ncbi:hypothetical protein HPB51_026353 [Rhipicephalus microplus]|uniref:DUF7041 domain-containing protein n=1 Tax=Rhipicephalus microplus TaxID=6941 RepID=A0A9J6D3B6_RHIMP|nr:hypothetical protein HPB51_026353 [Rhipicephalus microplus]
MHGGLAYGIGVSRYGAFLQLLFKSNRLRLEFGLKIGVANFISDHGSQRQNWRCDFSGQQLLELCLHNESHHFPQCFAAASQVEVHFRLREITSQQIRYWNLVSCLPRDVADDLADILASPHPSHPYDTLKAAINSRKSESEDSRLQQLITYGYRAR